MCRTWPERLTFHFKLKTIHVRRTAPGRLWWSPLWCDTSSSLVTALPSSRSGRRMAHSNHIPPRTPLCLIWSGRPGLITDARLMSRVKQRVRALAPTKIRPTERLPCDYESLAPCLRLGDREDGRIGKIANVSPPMPIQRRCSQCVYRGPVALQGNSKDSRVA